MRVECGARSPVAPGSGLQPRDQAAVGNTSDRETTKVSAGPAGSCAQIWDTRTHLLRAAAPARPLLCGALMRSVETELGLRGPLGTGRGAVPGAGRFLPHLGGRLGSLCPFVPDLDGVLTPAAGPALSTSAL